MGWGRAAGAGDAAGPRAVGKFSRSRLRRSGLAAGHRRVLAAGNLPFELGFHRFSPEKKKSFSTKSQRCFSGRRARSSCRIFAGLLRAWGRRGSKQTKIFQLIIPQVRFLGMPGAALRPGRGFVGVSSSSAPSEMMIWQQPGARAAHTSYLCMVGIITPGKNKANRGSILGFDSCLGKLRSAGPC